MNFTKTLAVAALAALPMIASAQFSANVSLVSNYKFRGQDQDISKTSAFKPALQGGFDYAHASGFYVGNWNSTVNWLANNSLESDIYAGYKFSSGALSFDVGALRYLYPGAGAANTTEIYGGVGYGPFAAKYSHTISDEYFGVTDGKGTGYLNLSYSQEVMKAVTLKASVGFTNYSSDSTGTDYTDYSVGAAYDFGSGVSLTGALVGANKKDVYGFVNKNRFVLMLTKAM